MEYAIFLSILVETGTIKKERAKKIYESLRYKNFPLDFDQTHDIVKSAFDVVVSEEKRNEKNIVHKK